jgi:hypothetical protein
VRGAAPAAAAMLTTLDARCGDIFRRHPDYEAPDVVPALRRLLSGPDVRYAVDLP